MNLRSNQYINSEFIFIANLLLPVASRPETGQQNEDDSSTFSESLAIFFKTDPGVEGIKEPNNSF